MGTTTREITGFLDAIELNYTVDDHGRVSTGFRTRNYRDPEGNDGLGLIIEISEDGEYFCVYVPAAYVVAGPNKAAFLEACMAVQWRTKLIQFKYDPSDGEIRPIVEFPLEDSKLTQRQLQRCIVGLVQIIEQYDVTLRKAAETGVVDLDASTPIPASVEAQVLKRTIAQMGEQGAPAAVVEALEQRLQALEAGPSQGG